MFISKEAKLYKILNIMEKPILYIGVLLIIIEGPSVYSYAQFGFSWLVNVFRIIIAILFSLLILINILRGQIDKSMIFRWLILCIVYYFIVFIELLATFRFIGVGGYIYFYAISLPLLFTYLYLKICNKEGNDFLYAFSDIVFVIAVISLFFWFFGSTLGIISTDESIIVSFGEPFESPSYLGIYFEHQTVDIFGIKNVIRNQGIFCEGPLYAACVSLALCVEIYMRPWKRTVVNSGSFIQKIRQFNILKVAVFYVTLITTLTTTGYIVAVVTFISMFFLYPIRWKNILKYKIIFGIVLFIVAAILISFIIIKKSDSMSFRIRIDDCLACLKAWITSPIFGVGAMNTENILEYISEFRAFNYGLSSGLGNVFAQGGIIFLIIYIVPLLYWIVNAIRNRNWWMVFFPIVFIMIFVLTLIDHITLTMSILAVGYANIIVKGKSSMFYFPKKIKIDDKGQSVSASC